MNITIEENLDFAKQKGLNNIDSWALMKFVTGMEDSKLFLSNDRELTLEQRDFFIENVENLLNGKPLAYITGKKEFYNLEFFVNNNVLIPRPESELIVDMVLEFVKKNGLKDVIIADIGTGSGCILLAIIKNLKESNGIGIDISKKALEVANSNAENLGIGKQITLLNCDLLDSFNDKVDIIVANLPYIGKVRFNFVAGNVLNNEPEIALFGGDDGLDLYRKLFQQINQKTWKPKIMFGEFGFGQEELMLDLLRQYFKEYHFEIINDLAGIPRIFIVKFN